LRNRHFQLAGPAPKTAAGPNCAEHEIMTKLEDIMSGIAGLSPEDRAKLRDWFEDLEARLFDERIERDAKVGKLDQLAAEARADNAAGRTREL
jgi:hypothetical protein